jgi:phage tail sheath gpL-like
MLSNAVSLARVSRIIGYKITKGNFATSSSNLPQRIAVLAEANTANQSTLDTAAKEITSAQQAGNLYGYGSPIYNILRILIPIQGGGVDGVPVIVYPQAEANGATSKVLKVVPTGVATGNGTHTLVIAGRAGIDGEFYDINVEEGDTASEICEKMTNAVNAILGSPVSATDYDYETRFESKWKGLTAEDISITVDTNDNDLGITYAVSNVQTAAGTPSISAALTSFGNEWNTIVVNSYGTVSSIMSTLEQFNGIPDPENPTGRFTGIIMKPFVAITGSVADNPSTITDTRLNNVTIAIAPAPLSPGLPMEAAANMTVLHAKVAQNTPHLDVAGKAYPDMPVPSTGNIGSMADYENRDSFVKKGCSTVDFSGGQYVVQDFVTTYHKLGENPPQYRYVRNLYAVDMNVRYTYYQLELVNVVDHVIAEDNDTVSAAKVIKPKQWKSILFTMMDDLANRALITDVPFSQNSIEVSIGTTNPDRLETFFRIKRSGVVRISDTTAETGFNFGS